MDKLQVLIIEDDKDSAVFFRTVLEMVGFESEIVLSAKEALAWLATSVPDIVLLDIRLGLEISGSDILLQIRTNSRFEKTRVIVITGYPRLAEPVTNLADLVLLKPVEVDQLKDLAKRIGQFEFESKNTSFRDPVTNLFNKDFFLSRLELALHRTNRRPEFLFAVTIFQHQFSPDHSDHFDPDPILAIQRQIAGRLNNHIRPTDTLSRFSGWKFATLHEELKHPDNIEIIIQRIQTELSKPYQVEGEVYHLAVNYGGVVYHPVYKKPEDIIETAEKALSQALSFDKAGFYAILTKPSLGFRTSEVSSHSTRD